MNKRKIIARLKKENLEDISFTNKYQKIRSKLNLMGKKRLPQHHIFKYAMASFLMVFVVVSSILIPQFLKTKDNSPETNDVTNNSEINHVYSIFENYNAQYLEEPIETYFIGEEIISIYLGILPDDKVIIVFTNKKINGTLNLTIRNENYIGSGDLEVEGEFSEEDGTHVVEYMEPLFITDDILEITHGDTLEITTIDLKEYIQTLKTKP